MNDLYIQGLDLKKNIMNLCYHKFKLKDKSEPCLDEEEQFIENHLIVDLTREVDNLDKILSAFPEIKYK